MPPREGVVPAFIVIDPEGLHPGEGGGKLQCPQGIPLAGNRRLGIALPIGVAPLVIAAGLQADRRAGGADQDLAENQLPPVPDLKQPLGVAARHRQAALGVQLLQGQGAPRFHNDPVPIGADGHRLGHRRGARGEIILPQPEGRDIPKAFRQGRVQGHQAHLAGDVPVPGKGDLHRVLRLTVPGELAQGVIRASRQGMGRQGPCREKQQGGT